jgi:hypothetical protein
LVGGDGRDLLDGRDGNDTLSGEEGSDTLRGGAGRDDILGGPGNDDLEGGAGDDNYLFAGSEYLGHDRIFEAVGNGTDTLDFRGISGGTGLTIDLSQAVIVNDLARLRLEYGDSVRSIENVFGTAYADQITGDGADNRLDGHLGTDTLLGGAGSDILVASQSSRFYGQAGFDLPEVVDGDPTLESTQFSLDPSPETWGSVGGGFNGGQREADPSQIPMVADATALWTFPDLPLPSQVPELKIYVTWDPEGATTILTTNAAYQVKDGAGNPLQNVNQQIPASINQQNAPRADLVVGDRPFQLLDVFPTPTNGLQVLLGNDAGAVLADAVMVLGDVDVLPPDGFELTETTITSDGYRPRWDHPDTQLLGVDGYRIQRSKTGLGESWTDWEEVNGPLATQPMATFTELLVRPDFFEGFYYRIQALNSLFGPSDWQEFDRDGEPVRFEEPREDEVVKVTAAVTAGTTPEVELKWSVPKHQLDSVFDIYRMPSGGTSWIQVDMDLTVPNPNPTPGSMDWTDNTVTADTVYEYRVVRREPGSLSGQVDGEGVVFAAVERELVENRGTVLLVIDDTLTGPLAFELARLKQDLAGDGWQWREILVTPDPVDNDSGNAVDAVKTQITIEYTLHPDINTVFLIGDIPVPYSGYDNPDGHGARSLPADAYYGDVVSPAESWKDVKSIPSPMGESAKSVNNNPDDKRFDQNVVPDDGDDKPLELAVGRIDLSNMPQFGGDFGTTAPLSGHDLQVALLKRYFDKDHAYRQGRFDDVQMQLATLNSSKNLQAVKSRWYNFVPIVGEENIVVRDWLTTMDDRSQAVLFADATKSAVDDEDEGWGPKSITVADGLATAADDAANRNFDPLRPETSKDIGIFTPNIAEGGTYSVFNTWQASYSVNWEKEDNIMLSLLANDGYGLTASWRGSESVSIHSLHSFATGEPIGTAHYDQAVRASGVDPIPVWQSLMGDPTLRMHVVQPPTDVVVSETNGNVSIAWTNSTDDGSAGFQGYHVYHATSHNGPFTRITGANPVPGGQSVTHDGSPTHVYMVRAVRQETTFSGAYTNASQGAFSRQLWEPVVAINYAGNQVGHFQADPPPATPETASIDLRDASIPLGIDEPLLEQLFQTRRFDSAVLTLDMTGLLTVNQTYAVRLYFADYAATQSVFDVTLQGSTVLDDYDVAAEMGGDYVGVVKTFSFTAADVDLNLQLAGQSPGQNPFISAIEVVMLN